MTLQEQCFDGQTAVVTGSSRGIGKAVATRLAEGGARVALNARGQEELTATVSGLRDRGAHAIGIPGNLSDKSVPRALIDSASDAFGSVDIVVNCVGISPYYGPLIEIDRPRFEKTILHNSWPGIALVREALRAGLDRRPGAVINVSTIAASQIYPNSGVYGASKAALDLLTRVTALDLAHRRIRVNAVAPGIVNTPFSQLLTEGSNSAAERDRIPLGRFGTPEDIAAAVAFLLSDDASWITGITLTVDGGRTLSG
jgi:NAD(P)-dependent dehydrogenase (short-subunit alcohol dehydrogenase family)